MLKLIPCHIADNISNTNISKIQLKIIKWSQGEGEVKIEDEEFKVGPMTAIFIPSNLLHGIENAGEKVLKYLVIVAK